MSKIKEKYLADLENMNDNIDERIGKLNIPLAKNSHKEEVHKVSSSLYPDDKVLKNKEKIGLKIVDLIHDITQMGYLVQFCRDFEGMIKIEYRSDYISGEKDLYVHEHLGHPDCERIVLEKKIIESLSNFKKEKELANSVFSKLLNSKP